MSQFVHLHTHTEFSLLDGACRIDKLIACTKELGMDTIAITDHGSMYGVIKFYKEAKKQGIKPILGCEVYTAPRSRLDMEGRQDAEPGHLVLLAQNNVGWNNILKIVSIGYTEGFYYKPRIDMETLAKYSDGIIALSACLAGDIARCFTDNEDNKAKEYALKFIEIFGRDNFFIELQDHGIELQRSINGKLIGLAKELNVGVVVTNDIHYIKKKDAKVHDALICIQTGKTVADEKRLRFDTEEFYLKSPDEMRSIFPNLPQAVENTVKIGNRCNVNIEFDNIHLPKFHLDIGVDAFEYLKSLCLIGLHERYGDDSDKHLDRLDYELNTIKNMGYIDYFLIVWDFIKYAKDNGIMVGPGRGSAAGSIVAYSLKITDIDPIKYNLLFERFLNPERVSMPDIDVDFCIERRQEVIDYVIAKYGAANVAQIITFGTLGAKQAIRDCARVLAMPYADADRISKLIPFEIKMTISKALSASSELKQLYETDEAVKRVIDIALELEGMARHASTHAAGVVICENPVTDYVPLSRNGDIITTQFDMDTIQELGLLKMDFLGLRNLTIMRYALNLIFEGTGEKIDLSKIDFSVPGVYEMLSMGYTDGVFQLESRGMKAFIKELTPTSLEDLIAGISLFRPGPMDQIPMYISNKNSKQNIKYKHPLLIPILDVTYGCMVYQEQVMQIARDLGGYSFGRADLVRRAMSKKKLDVMKKERNNFIFGIVDDAGNIEVEGALRRGVDEKTANGIFDEMMDFANYAFNKSHAAAYAVIAYQTAYLKYFYPTQFMAALLSNVLSDATKVSRYIAECNRMGIKLLPPDVNYSYDGFTVDGFSIRFGLAGVKNVGHNFVKSVIEERKNGNFTSFKDFAVRMAGNELNKRAVECLIKSGAFDSFGLKRSQLLEAYERILESINSDKKQNIEGQTSLFGEIEESNQQDEFKEIAECTHKELLSMEKETIGIYISGHPLNDYTDIIQKVGTVTTEDLVATEDGQSLSVNDGDDVTMAGIIVARRDKVTKNGSTMSFVTIEDLYGTIELVIFPRVYDNCFSVLIDDNVIVVKGLLQTDTDKESKIIVNSIISIDNIDLKKSSKRLYVKVELGKDFLIDRLKNTASKYPGNTQIYIHLEEKNKTFVAENKYNVTICDELLNNLYQIFGSNNIKIKELI